jgi:predicted phage tail protein
MKKFFETILRPFRPIVKIFNGIVGEIVSWFIDIPDADDFANQQQGFLVNKESNIASIPIVYGERKIGGTRVFVSTSGSNNQYLYIVLVLCEGEIQAIEDVYFNDVISTDAKFSGLLTINKYIGTDAQTADSMLVNANIGWTANHRLRGIAYLAVRIAYNRDVFSSIPTINCLVQGRKILDTRTSTTAYSTNPAMCLRDYLVNARYGKGLSSSLIDTASFNQAATDCDTLVAKYTGASNSKIFECNAIIDTNQKIFDNVSIFLRGMRGIMPFQNGLYRLIFEKDTASVYSIGVDKIVGGIGIASTRKSQTYNKVIARFTNPEANWQPDSITWPPAGSSEESQFLSEDSSVEMSTQIDLPTITSVYAAKDIARIVCLASRRSKLSVSVQTTLDVMEVTVGDIIQLSHPTPAWTNKEFRVNSMQITPDGLVSLNLQEHVDSIYPWETGAEIDPVVESTLPDPFSVVAPTNLSVTPSSFLQQDGTASPVLSVTWTASADFFVARYEVQYRKGAEDYQSLLTEETQLTIFNVLPTASYDVRVRAINSIDARSDFVTVENSTAVGDTTAPSAPSGLQAFGGTNQISLFWTNPADSDLDVVQIWEGTSSVQANASFIATTKASSFVRGGLSDGVTRYYWLKAVDYSGNVSGFNSPTGVSATTVTPFSQADVIGDIEVVGSLTAGLGAGDEGKVEFLTTDNKIYLWTGSAWITGVAASDLTGQITGVQITDNAVTAAKIAANTITASQIAAGTITAAQIAASTITSDKLSVANLSAISADLGTITAGSMSADRITTGVLSAQRVSVDGITLDRSGSNLIIKNSGVSTVKLVANAATDLVGFASGTLSGVQTYNIDFTMESAGDICCIVDYTIGGSASNSSSIQLFANIQYLSGSGNNTRTISLSGIIVLGPTTLTINRVNDGPAGSWRLTVQTLNASNIGSLTCSFNGAIIQRYR